MVDSLKLATQSTGSTAIKPALAPRPLQKADAPAKLPAGQSDVAQIAVKQVEAPSLSDVVARAKQMQAEQAAQAPAVAAEKPGEQPVAKAPSLAISEVQANQELKASVEAAISLEGTAKILKMTEDACEIRLSVKGSSFLTKGVQRDEFISIARQQDGSLMYKTRDEKTGEVTEGQATDLVVKGSTKTFSVIGEGGKKIPFSLKDEGSQFILSGEGVTISVAKN